MIAALLLTVAHADYTPPEPEVMIAKATSIVEATVVRYDAKGTAVLKVHSVLAGEKVQAIDGVSLSCMPNLSIEGFGVKVDHRYVFLVDGALMTEEQTFFEVTGKDVAFWTPDEGDGFQRQPQSLRAVKSLIERIRQTP